MTESWPIVTEPSIKNSINSCSLFTEHLDEWCNRQHSFDSAGDMLGDIVVYQYQKQPSTTARQSAYTSVLIGAWKSNTDDLVLNLDRVNWTIFRSNESVKSPSNGGAVLTAVESVCSRPCGVGEFSIQLSVPCCWRCQPCRDNEVQIETCMTFNHICWKRLLQQPSCQSVF